MYQYTSHTNNLKLETNNYVLFDLFINNRILPQMVRMHRDIADIFI